MIVEKLNRFGILTFWNYKLLGPKVEMCDNPQTVSFYKNRIPYFLHIFLQCELND